MLPIKARNFIWFLRVLRVCLAVTLKRFFLGEIPGGQVACFSGKRTCSPDRLSDFRPWKPLSPQSRGLQGAWPWPARVAFSHPSTLQVAVYLCCSETRPLPAMCGVPGPSAGWCGGTIRLRACAAVVGCLQCLESGAGSGQSGHGDCIAFCLLFYHPPSPLGFPLPPPAMYSNYTETATTLYIVFGSNSMRR